MKPCQRMKPLAQRRKRLYYEGAMNLLREATGKAYSMLREILWASPLI